MRRAKENVMKITPVILSGGGGTRLWPLSTPEKPKQFLALTGERTMFQLTVDRVADRTLFSAPLIVSGARHAEIAEEQLASIGIHDAILILEPCARNTAPAIALAALAVPDPDALLLIMPSDHVITDPDSFIAASEKAAALANEGWIVTYGIAPTGPETGYGYIKMGAAIVDGVQQVDRFIEKPEAEKAAVMLAEGNHSWNGGIFMLRADIYLAALADHAPDILEAAQKAVNQAAHEGQRILPDEAAFASSPSDSIDYAVMENAAKESNGRVAVVPVSMGWSDVGSWDALYELGAKDDDGNAVIGDSRLVSASGNLVQADGIRVSIHGVDDLIVVANGREVMIIPRGQSQKVKDFS
jgi:mannose-1-phosphate guanylyltransferase